MPTIVQRDASVTANVYSGIPAIVPTVAGRTADKGAAIVWAEGEMVKPMFYLFDGGKITLMLRSEKLMKIDYEAFFYCTLPCCSSS
jgi:hypothetical protein